MTRRDQYTRHDYDYRSLKADYVPPPPSISDDYDLSKMKACKNCHALTSPPPKYLSTIDNEARECLNNNRCPRCREGVLSRDWDGILCILDFEKSEIAMRMGITENGMYALRVR